MSEVKIGQPVMLIHPGGECVYGRALDFDGGSMRMVTPGNSVLQAGCVWFSILDDAGMERLREFEALAKVPYGGRLTPEQMSLDRHGNATAPAVQPDALAEARAEIARLRARVRVEPEDVRRAGVGWPHVVAWLKRAGWVSSYQAHGLAWRPEPGAFLSIIPGQQGGPARAVGIIGDLYKRPGLDILDEMAALAPSEVRS